MTRTRQGFTLIELSIVLVIIGLIVGGVLIGQDLIKGAEIRAAVSQIEKYDAATNTFRNKYSGLPGDVLNPARYGFADTNLAPDGNGRITRSLDTNPDIYLSEAEAFFRHLSQANLIPENITQAIFTDHSDVADFAPLSKLGKGARVYVYNRGGLNYYGLIGNAVSFEGERVQFGTWNDSGPVAGLLTIDAYQIDTKMDDGLATTGRITAIYDFITDDPSGECHTAGVYGVATNASGADCNLQIRGSF